MFCVDVLLCVGCVGKVLEVCDCVIVVMFKLVILWCIKVFVCFNYLNDCVVVIVSLKVGVVVFFLNVELYLMLVDVSF